MSKFPRIINVSNIKIKALENAATAVHTITADCTATTFVLVEPTKAATPAVAGAPAAPGAPAPRGTRREDDGVAT